MFDYGAGLLSVMSLLESSITGKLLCNRDVEQSLSNLNLNIRQALIDYLNNSSPINNTGNTAKETLTSVVNHRQDIFNGNYEF